MAVITLTIKGDKVPTYAQFAVAFEDVTYRHLFSLMGDIHALAEHFSPVGVTGNFKAGLKSEVIKINTAKLAGIIYSGDTPVIKSYVIEGVNAQGERQQYGRKPGKFAPVQVIREWVAFKFGLTDPREINAVAYRVNLKIRNEGILAVRPISTAVQLKQPVADNIIVNVIPAEIAKRL
jgi:hypothetical protein